MQEQRHPLWRLARWAIGLELGYLVLVNGALWLPITQDVVSAVRPERFQVRWQQAWSWYPGRVHAEGIWANGQTRSQQWQLEARSASATVALLPLLLKRVNVHSAEAADLDFRQRPRLRPERDYSARLAHFPAIDGREVLPVDDSPRPQRRPWHIELHDLRASGDHRFWIYNLQGGATGAASAALTMTSPGGPLELTVTDTSLDFTPVTLNGDRELISRAQLSGSIGFAPFMPREHKGIKLLPFAVVDAELDATVDSLAFLDLFTSNLGDVAIDGAGAIAGQLRLREGRVLAGTDLRAEAPALAVGVYGVQVTGDGDVRLHTPPDADEPMALDVRYRSLTATRDGDAAPFLAGDNLALSYAGGNNVVPAEGVTLSGVMQDSELQQRRALDRLSLQIDEATLKDLAIINDYLPPNAPVVFTGGSARLDADLEAGFATASGELTLVSNAMELSADGQDLEGRLAVSVVLAGGDPRARRFDLSGTQVTLDQIRVAGAREVFEADYWSAVVRLDPAEVVLSQPPALAAEAQLTLSDTRPLVALFSNHSGAPRWLARLLTLKDVAGSASLSLADQVLTIEQAQVASDRAEVLAHARIAPLGRQGAVYARYEKLDATLTVDGEERDILLRDAREQFDNYRLDGEAP